VSPAEVSVGDIGWYVLTTGKRSLALVTAVWPREHLFNVQAVNLAYVGPGTDEHGNKVERALKIRVKTLTEDLNTDFFQKIEVTKPLASSKPAS
jgi:hypothetical protein